MPRDVYTPLSLLRVIDIEAFADWLKKVKGDDDDDASDEPRDSVVPIDDFEA